MEILARFDEKNYNDTKRTLEKYSVRGIIMRGNELAMQCSKDGEYKIPGGGLEPGETYVDALIREVREETGLCVIRDKVSEIGEIVELRRDIFDKKQKYVCHSLFFFCEVEKEMTETHLTESEQKKGYYLKWARPEEIYNTNILVEKDPWIIRDTAFIKMLMDGRIELPQKT